MGKASSLGDWKSLSAVFRKIVSKHLNSIEQAIQKKKNDKKYWTGNALPSDTAFWSVNHVDDASHPFMIKRALHIQTLLVRSQNSAMTHGNATLKAFFLGWCFLALCVVMYLLLCLFNLLRHSVITSYLWVSGIHFLSLIIFRCTGYPVIRCYHKTHGHVLLVVL